MHFARSQNDRFVKWLMFETIALAKEDAKQHGISGISVAF
jgi:hypothetical protein